MKYFVTIEGRELEVDVDGERITVAGKTIGAHLCTNSSTPEVRLVVGTRSFPIAVSDRNSDGWTLLDRGVLRVADVVDQRTRHIRALTMSPGASAGGGLVKAPMPGLVVKVLVASGSEVTKGQGLVVLEAMKMENELKAPADGIVKEVNVVAGQAVEKGAVLVMVTTPNQES